MYNFSDIQKKCLRKYEKVFQSVVCLVANKKCGVEIDNDNFSISFPFKYEGGVVVNGKVIVISDNRCYNENRKGGKEEAIVDEVLNEMIVSLDFKNLTKSLEEYALSKSGLEKGKLRELVGRAISNPFNGDPLNSFFDS